MLGLAKDAGAQDKKKPPLKARLHAWWEGYELAHQPDEPDAGDDVPEAIPELPAGEPVEEHSLDEGWTQGRIEFNEKLWGPGLVGPGDEAHVLDMLAPLGLTKEHSVVELGSRLGGIARIITNNTGAWVTGYEDDPHLAEEAMEQSTMAGLAKRAPIKHSELSAVKIRKRTIDCVFSKEAFFTIADKKKLLDRVHTMLKVEGHLLFTDLVAAGADSRGPATEVWAAQEPVAPALWTVDEIRAALEALKLDVRITEDITEEYRQRTVAAFKDLLTDMEKKPLKPDLAGWAMAETEYWTRRVAVIDSGEVKVYRFYARVPFPS
jgi:cyclopropane fatty-acyl-phospholipid synthase-like methyltransferase